MKIAILGNGKMGKRIGELAKKNGDKIIAVSSSNMPAISIDLSVADVAIDFSTPSSAFENISHAIRSGVPIVSGTTGWIEEMQDIEKLCIEKNGAFLYASNFSLGMNIFFEINKKLAELMKNHKYKSRIHEIHHTEKLDSPSGTAVELAEQIENILNIKSQITTDRINNITGTHQITYDSSVDKIEIKHIAKNRDGFAMGAIIAAKWIIGKKGIFRMQDVLAQ